MTTNIYVLYHAHCTDGTGSKFAAWSKFKTGAKYIAVNYGKPVPDMEPNSEVYILDFSYPKDVLEKLQSIHKSVTVLDHHKTAEDDLKGLKGCHFNMNKSGCVMSWEYFHPGSEAPELLKDIQDRDLWQFQRPNSKFVHVALALLEGDMTLWDRIVKKPEFYDLLVENGKSLLQKQDLTVKSAVKGKVKIIEMFGHRVGITNYTDLASEIGNAICLDKALSVAFAVVYCITNENRVLLSLRSIGDFDVSAIAKTHFGGGGHKNASGAVIDILTLASILQG